MYASAPEVGPCREALPLAGIDDLVHTPGKPLPRRRPPWSEFQFATVIVEGRPKSNAIQAVWLLVAVHHML